MTICENCWREMHGETCEHCGFASDARERPVRDSFAFVDSEGTRAYEAAQMRPRPALRADMARLTVDGAARAALDSELVGMLV